MIRIIFAFAVSRLALVLVVLCLPHADRPQSISGQGLSWQTPPPGQADSRPYLISQEPLLDLMIRHDGTYYLQIAAFSYTTPRTYVAVKEGFFPGYPYLIRFVHSFFPEDDPKYWLVAAGLVSNLCALLAALLIFLIAKTWLSREVAQCTAIAFLVQPFGGVLAVALSESLFILLCSATLWITIRKPSDPQSQVAEHPTQLSLGRFALAASCAGAAAFTRPPGIVLCLYLLAVLWQNRPARPLAWIGRGLCLLLVPLGFMLALSEIGQAAGDLTLWFKVQSAYGHASFPTFTGVQELFTFTSLNGSPYWRTLLQLVVLCVYTPLIATVYCSSRFRSLRLQLTWLLPAFLLPVLAGSIISLPRYSVVLWPLLIPITFWIAHWRPSFKWLIFLLSLLLQAFLFWTMEAHWPLVI